MARRLELLAAGRLTVREGGRSRAYGGARDPELTAEVRVDDPAFWERVAWGGSIGAAEAFCDGMWSTSDLPAVVRVFIRNREVLDSLETGISALAAPARRLLHHLRANTRSGSIRNIASHYDAGNELFALFLDPTLTYSCAVFPDGSADLERAQRHKLDGICRQLKLSPDDHLLEIGTGWGGLAIHAARETGCRVTTTTISRRQFEHASGAVAAAGVGDRVTLLRCDYRDLPARLGCRFDKLVSIEMIEAVGHRYLERYFRVLDQMLAPRGLALLQAITIADDRYESYRRSVDFIQRYVFPGGLLPSLPRIRRGARRAGLAMIAIEDLTPHYVRTLEAWDRRFAGNEDEIAALGLGAAERRKWRYYFGYCAAGFQERTIGDVQLLFEKP